MSASTSHLLGVSTARSAPRVALVALALLCGCLPSKEDRCAELKTQLNACLGTRFERLNCGTVADADLERLLAITDNASCAVVAAALPFDGDLVGAGCQLASVGCIAPLTPAPSVQPTQYPVVLVNGIDTSPLFRYSDRILRTMREAGGHQVFLATLTPYESPLRRAPELWARVQEVLAQTGAAKVNLVCHSLGGLDCRYLVSPNGLGADLGTPGIADSVASITTIGTAHRGTRIADVLLGLLPDQRRGELINDFATLAGDWFSDAALRDDVHLREGLQALSITQAASFNDSVVDAPGVYYQSWAGYSRPFGESSAEAEALLQRQCATDDGADGLGPYGRRDYMALPLVPFTEVVGQDGNPNDGLATVASAHWGHFQGCIPADHMEQLGQRNLPDTNVRTGFDVARFYANVASGLAARGF